MFNAEQTNPFGPEVQRHLRIFGRVCVGTDAHCAERIHHFHKFFETGIFRSIHGFNGLVVDKPPGAVQTECCSL